MLLLVNFLISGLNLQGSGGGRENPHQQRKTQGEVRCLVCYGCNVSFMGHVKNK